MEIEDIKALGIVAVVLAIPAFFGFVGGSYVSSQFNSTGRSVYAKDIDGDGREDIVVQSGSNQRVYYQTPEGDYKSVDEMKTDLETHYRQYTPNSENKAK